MEGKMKRATCPMSRSSKSVWRAAGMVSTVTEKLSRHQRPILYEFKK